MVIQLGYPPNRIDLLTDLEAADFETCYELREEIELDGLIVKFVDVKILIKIKKYAGRLQDLADIEKLESGKKNDET